jgi:hypothetical protein
MAAKASPSSVEREEAGALGEAERTAPDQDASVAIFGRDVDAYDAQGTGTQSEDATVKDWAVADALRPDLDAETSDGLGDVDEEVRHMAEDLPADEPWELRVRRKAHELWVSEGGPHGRAEDHWRIAAQLVAEEDAGRSDLLPYGDDADQPVEEARTLENLGEFPGLADQGDENSRSTEPDSEPSSR